MSEREEFGRLGKAALERVFSRAGKTLTAVSLRSALDRFAAPNEAELIQAVGRNRVAPTQVLEAVLPRSGR